MLAKIIQYEINSRYRGFRIIDVRDVDMISFCLRNLILKLFPFNFLIIFIIVKAEYWNNYTHTSSGEIKFDWDTLVHKCSKIQPLSKAFYSSRPGCRPSWVRLIYFFITNFNISSVSGIKETLLSFNPSGLHS